jgi:sugar phosphate isomerase/epimerase
MNKAGRQRLWLASSERLSRRLMGEAGDAWGRLSGNLNAVCEFAAGYGVRIAIEPADRYETDLIHTTADAMRLIHELGHSNLGLVLDTGHAHVAGESPAQAVCIAGDRLFHVHVDDNLGQRDQHLIPGEGSIDFQSFLGALEEAGYNGFVCAELSWDYTVDPEPAVRQTLSHLRSLCVKSRQRERSR